MNQKGLVSATERNWNFFSGNQWVGLESDKRELPVLNMIKPVVKYKNATVAQNRMVAVYSDMEEREEYTEICKILNKVFTMDWEKAKMDQNLWRIIRAASVQGDSYLYFGTENAADVQILHNTQIFFGNEQENRIQKQPYIILYERKSVEEVKEIAKNNGVSKREIDLIVSDEMTEYEIGNKNEVGDKCTLLTYFDRDSEGYVRVGRAVRHCMIEPMRSMTALNKEKVVGGLKSYPIVSMIWEELPNSARGNSEVAQLIPNQIAINKNLVRRDTSVMMTAFPRIAYDSNSIDNPEALEIVGAAIGINGNANGIDAMIKYLNPASMSHDAESLLNDFLTLSRDLAGAGDAATGDINPERASGAAITAVRDQQALPLNEQASALKQFVEDFASLRYDMLLAYMDENGIEVPLEDEGVVVKKVIRREMLMGLKPNIKIDVSTDNGWTKFAEQQELVNLLNAGMISLEEYVELLPDGSPLPKNKMKQILERRKNVGNLQMQEMLGGISEDTGGLEGIQGPQFAL